MAKLSKIEWTDSTWNPIRFRVKANAAQIARDKSYTSLVPIAKKMAGRIGQHCEHVSAGCKHCYAETNNHRCLPANGTGLPYDRRNRDLVDPFIDEKVLLQPLKWGPVLEPCLGCKDALAKGVIDSTDGCSSLESRPRRIFPMNQSDLFGEWVTDEMLDRIFAVMALCPQHIFQVLTKRPERMLRYLTAHGRTSEVYNAATAIISGDFSRMSSQMASHRSSGDGWWPLPNVWLGVSVENQAAADERIPILLQTPAAVRFVSCEPMLGTFDLKILKGCPGGIDCTCCHAGCDCGCRDECPKWLNQRRLDWVICGGESGPGARSMQEDWARSLRDQCKAAVVPFFFKQWGEWLPAMCDGAEGDGQQLNCSDAPVRVGKHAAGSLLDGVEHKQFPEVNR